MDVGDEGAEPLAEARSQGDGGWKIGAGFPEQSCVVPTYIGVLANAGLLRGELLAQSMASFVAVISVCVEWVAHGTLQMQTIIGRSRWPLSIIVCCWKPAEVGSRNPTVGRKASLAAITR